MCARVPPYTAGQTRRTFIYFCYWSGRTLVLNFLALEWERERELRPNEYFALASLPINSTFFIFLSIKFVVYHLWNETVFKNGKLFLRTRILFISQSANSNTVAKCLRSQCRCVFHLFLSVYSYYNECSMRVVHHRRQTLDNWLFQSDF